MEDTCLQTSSTTGSRERGRRGKISTGIWEFGADDDETGAICTFSGSEGQVAPTSILPLFPPGRGETEPTRGRSRGGREGGRGKQSKSSNQTQKPGAAGASEFGDGNLWTNSAPPLLPWSGAAVMGGLLPFAVGRGFPLGEQSRLSNFVEIRSVGEAEVMPGTSKCIGELTPTSCLERGPNLNLLGDFLCNNDPITGSSKRKGVRKTLNEIRQQSGHPLDRPTAASTGEDACFADPGRLNFPKRYRELPAATVEEFAHLLPDLKIIWDWQSYCPYATCSPKLRHIYDDEKPQVSSLPLFGSSHVTPCTDRTIAEFYDLVINVGGSVWALDWCPNRQECQFEGFREEFLAVGAHPHESPVHRLGEPVFGRGLIQIWAFSLPSFLEAEICSTSGQHHQPKKRIRGRGRTTAKYQAHDRNLTNAVDEADCSQKALVIGEPSVHESWTSIKRSGQDFNFVNVVPGGDEWCRDQRNGTQGSEVDIMSLEIEGCTSEMASTVNNTFYLPQMVLGLAHDGGVTWDAKWQPAIDSFGSQKIELHRLGYLAVVFGDGSLQVFDVPLPNIVYHLKYSENRDSDVDPVIVKITPVFKCSGLPCRGAKSMPLTLEWSSSPHDYLLVGCHDGVVALWKFCPTSCSDKDTRPLMCFVADSAPIRAIAWSPDGGGNESGNVIATAGHSGRLQVWDLRDPFHPIWDLILSKGGCILSMDWLSTPRSIVLSMDDGSVRTLSLDMAVSDTAVTGKPCTKTLGYGLHSYFCSSLALWTVHVSRTSGLAMCGGEDGSVIQFQLTEKNMKQERVRTRHSHCINGRFVEDVDTGVLSIISQHTPIVVQMKKFRNDNSQTPLSKMLMPVNFGSLDDDQAGGTVARRQASQRMSKSAKQRRIKHERTANTIQSPAENVDSLAIIPYDGSQPEKLRSDSSEECCTVDDTNDSKRGKQNKGGKNLASIMMAFDGNAVLSPSLNVGDVQSTEQLLERLPPKSVSVQRLRWNQNRGSDSCLCFGGAAGIVRCRVMSPQT